MSHFFAYDELTWPEIYSLARNVPLIIPLGSGYDMQRVASALGDPEAVGLLPAIPYGWPGSGLEVAEKIFSNLLRNLLDSLADDGFSNVFALTPQGLNLDSDIKRLIFAHPSQFEARDDLPGDQARDQIIIIPIGHTEQHGFHLPMSTDTIIIEAIGERTAQQSLDGSSPALCLPVMPYGVSTHRASFAGTLNCGGRAFEDFWVAIVDQLSGRGFERFYLMSGHGGNSSFLVNVVKYSGERHRRIFCATAYLYLSGPQGIEALEKYRQSPVGGMGHACELETSLIQVLRPELVHLERVVDEMDFISTPSYYMDWVEGGALVANPPWEDDSCTGAYGAGSLGTAEKGQLWLEAAVAEKLTHLDEINEQFTRREARRRRGYGIWGNQHSSR